MPFGDRRASISATTGWSSNSDSAEVRADSGLASVVVEVVDLHPVSILGEVPQRLHVQRRQACSVLVG